MRNLDLREMELRGRHSHMTTAQVVANLMHVERFHGLKGA